MRDIDYNYLFLMALRGQGRQFIHQISPMNVNRCLILSVTSSFEQSNAEPICHNRRLYQSTSVPLWMQPLPNM